MSTATIEVDDIPVAESTPFPVKFQDKFYTDDNGPSARLRVDNGQTGFFAGREFRSFKEFNLTSGQNYVIKVVAAVDTILFDLGISLITGEIKLYTRIGGTEGGTFSETLPVLPRNNMSERPTPLYTAQNVLTAGGTHSGGTTLDLLWTKTVNNSNQASATNTSADSERGVAAGTYYFIVNAVSDSTGVLHARWEERV